jgi:hypothetical protein
MGWYSDPDMDSVSEYWEEPDNRPLLLPGKADLIPVEILSEIFLLTLKYWSLSKKDLVLVCRRWHAIILSTPDIHSQLTIRRATQKEVVQEFIQGRKSRLDVTVNINEGDFNAENFHACFMAAAQAASRWSSLNIISPPPHGEYTNLQVLQPLTHLKSFRAAGGFDGFLESLMTAISRGASPNLTIMELADPVAVHYLGRPAGWHITHSLTTLKIQLSKRMDGPVDILPHLHRLEYLEARHLCLPFFPPNASLPLTRTLRYLNVKSVSIQWMADRVFLVLEHCKIIFPRHADNIHALQPVSMPSCSHLVYHSNDLQTLEYFRFLPLKSLDVQSGQWNVWRGNPQLVALCPVAATGAKSLTHLHLEVQCSERLLLYMLSLIPTLEFLWLRLARPNTLSKTFFQAFVVREPNTDRSSDIAGPPNQTIAPLCPLLSLLHLHYRIWLFGPVKRALIVALSDIVASRNLGIHRSLKLSLSFDGGHMEGWSIGEPVRKSRDLRPECLILGILVRHCIIPISTTMPPQPLVPFPFTGADYLHLWHPYGPTSFECLFIDNHMGLMERLPPPASLPRALPFFDALRVLVVEGLSPSFLAAHTFHKLERCRVAKSFNYFGTSPILFTLTEMPVCTRIDIDNPYLLATIELPQIQDLAYDFEHPYGITIWEEYIAVNANLSGLKLLHMKQCTIDEYLIPILRSLPLLETLICFSWSDAVSFRPFLPMDENVTSGLKRTSGDGQTLALLCPRLQSLQIEGQDPSEKPELIRILKDIVTLRAECGSPLKHFTFSKFWPKPGSRFELIGRNNGSFTMEKIVLPVKAKEFQLDI